MGTSSGDSENQPSGIDSIGNPPFSVDEAEQDRSWGDPEEVFGWKMYDWGWSAFSTTVVTALFGPYVIEMAGDGGVNLFGWNFESGSILPLAISISAILQVIILPLIGSAADYSPNKRSLLLGLAYASSAVTLLLYFTDSSDFSIWLGVTFFVLAAVGWAAAGVIYNSFLNDIAAPPDRDAVSAGGFALGYIGGGIWLAINFAMVLLMEDKLAVKLSLGGTGIWAAVFIYLFTHQRLNERPAKRVKPADQGWISLSARSSFATAKEIVTQYPVAFRYLLAYILFNDGILTVVNIAASFGKDELNASATQLLLLVLMVQIIAAPGAVGFGKLANRYGSKNSLMASLVVWIGLVFYAYLFLETITQFFLMGVVLAFIMGGSQAISRSLFAQVIPPSKEAEYFGFFEIASRGTSWIGPLVFVIVNERTGSQRQAILSLVVFFVVGLILLKPINFRKGMEQAGVDPTGVRL